MKIVFMGTPDFSVPALDALINAGHEIVAVYCQPPRPAGRGKKDRRSSVQVQAELLGLEVRHPVSLRSAEEHAAFASLKADIAVVVAYGLILPQTFLDAPKLGCLNIHASLLPRWRGAAPVHRAVMAGDTETGVCIMQMDAGLDTGPVLSRSVTPIGHGETMGQLHDRLSGMGGDLVVETLATFGNLNPEPQSDLGVTFAQKIEKTEAKIDWLARSVEIDRKIRGLSPFPGAWTEIDGQRIKLLLSSVVAGDAAAGTVLDDKLTIACGDGAVQLLRLQRAGKTAQSAEQFLNGFPMEIGRQI
ncbi:methionyl-tRNA formyltransferase [Pseudopelagicola sp. nBUS_19]|uniref:methionyl-tRNA formyltransferase n=1 Tax=Pseudopelagicola sp. nBUS_19 TaxID=3395316 RepID=UPI003EB7C3EE